MEFLSITVIDEDENKSWSSLDGANANGGLQLPSTACIQEEVQACAITRRRSALEQGQKICKINSKNIYYLLRFSVTPNEHCCRKSDHLGQQ